jgi:hypothetical protein
MSKHTNKEALEDIECGWGDYVANHLGKYEDLDHNEVALAIIARGKGGSVGESLSDFEVLNSEVALALIADGNGFYVARNLDEFEGLTTEVALALITAGAECEFGEEILDIWGGGEVAESVGNFGTSGHSLIAMALIHAGEGAALTNNLGGFEDLNQDVALQLIAREGANYVVDHLLSFTPFAVARIIRAISVSDDPDIPENVKAFAKGVCVDLTPDQVTELEQEADTAALMHETYLYEGARDLRRSSEAKAYTAALDDLAGVNGWFEQDPTCAAARIAAALQAADRAAVAFRSLVKGDWDFPFQEGMGAFWPDREIDAGDELAGHDLELDDLEWLAREDRVTSIEWG